MYRGFALLGMLCALAACRKASERDESAVPISAAPESAPIPATAESAPSLDPVPRRVLTGGQAWPWERVECYEDLDPHFVQEDFEADDADFSDNDRLAFDGDATPHSRFFLLHYGQGWQQATQPVPVLLCPGAIRSASVIFHDAKGDGTGGIAPFLIARGYSVFALTYAYPSGDNRLQAEHVANALSLVRHITGRSRVDLVTISKGGLPVRLYLSQMDPDWRTPYRGDVRRCVLIGAPNDGQDGMFRHPMYALAIDRLLPWDRRLTALGWVDTFEKSLYNTARSVGHLQMLKRWDGTYPILPVEPDAWTTYYGGWGAISHSFGIDEAIALGGNMIDRLNAHGLHPGIELAVLAGSKWYIEGVLVEYQGPGDGAVFVDSALHTDGMTQNGATVLKKTVMFKNHGELLWDEEPLGWIDEVLKQ